MTQQRALSIKLWEHYRDIPVIPASFSTEQREALRGVIGNVASVVHLKDTISSSISEGYREDSSLMAILRTRLKEAEVALERFEGVLYGTQERA